MLIGEAVAALGIEEPEDRDVCIAVPRDGRWLHAPLRQCAHREIDEYGAVYLASGLFERGKIRRWGGRIEANVREVLWLPFDADLDDWWARPKEEIHALPDDELWAHVEMQRADLEEAFARIGLPIHRLDYTGYGLCAYVRVEREAGAQVAAVRALHRRIVERINALARFELLDDQVKDAGTRVTRLVPSVNDKGPIPRRARELFAAAGAVGLAELEAAAGPGNQRGASQPPTVLIPAHGRELGADAAEAVVAAIAPRWSEGNRHDLALGLGGMFAKAGMPEAQALAIVGRLAADDEERRDRERAVATSYERVRSGLEVEGFHRLRRALGDDLAGWLDRELDGLRRATSARIVTPHRDRVLTAGARREPERPAGEGWDERWASGYDDPPEACLRGLVGEYVELMRPTTEAPPAFHMASLVTLVGAMTGRAVHTPYASQPVYGNLFTVLIGPTGTSRKDTAIKRALSLKDSGDGRVHLVPNYALHRDVSSAEGLISTLKADPNTLLYLTELTGLLANARRKSTSTILDRLIEAWDTPHVLQNLNKHSPVQAVNPYLTILAATQPKRLAEHITDEDIHSGFANRWLYVPGNGTGELDMPPPVDRAKAWELYRRLHELVRGYGEGTALPVLPEARERWKAWFSGLRREAGRNEDEDAMRVRHPEMALKVALCHAVLAGARGLGDAHIEAGIATVEWSWKHQRRMLAGWGIGVDSQIEQRVRAALGRHGAISRRRLQQITASRKWSGIDLARVIDAMQKNREIDIDPAGIVVLREED